MPTEPVTFPLWPRPGVVETLEWLTHVMISEDGSEERTELRDAPRQAFQFEFYVPPIHQARIDNIIYGARALEWRVPVWPQVQHVGAVEAALTSLDCETRYSEFREGGEVMLWESPDKWQVLPAEVDDDDTLALGEETEAFADAWLMPVRRGRLVGNPQRRLDGRQSIVQMTFRIEDNAELVPAAPDQFLGDDLYTEPGLLDGGQSMEQVVARIDVHDERLGLVSQLAPWTNVRPQRIHRMMAETPAEAWAIREFLHRRAGRSRAFWQPSFERDFRVNHSGAVTTSLTVHPDDYPDFAAARTHIAIETASGWLARTITGTNLIGASELQLILSSTLGGIDASAIRRVCYLGLRRLDTDRAEIHWIGGRVATCAVNTIEVEP